MSRRLSVSAEAGTTMRHVLHEMRTPLTQIIGYSEMLQEEARDRGQEEQISDLEQIRTAAHQLQDFVERLFQPAAMAESDVGAPADATSIQARQALADSNAAASRGPRHATGRLLIVDDEDKNREFLARRLERVGHRVVTVALGRDALAAIEYDDFDLVLLDVMMPGMSGLEVLRAVRSTRSASELPIIMATALSASEDMVAALGQGANDYVTKPFDFPLLLARVTTQLELRGASQQIAGLAQELEIRNAFIRRTFGRYVSDEVVSNLLDNPAGLELQGENRRVTILMSDLRGFSSLTESLSPTQIVTLLNSYLGAMADIIQSQGGTVDEFLGDAVLAFFGAPIARADDPVRAVVAAVEMQLAMARVNESNRQAGLPEIEMGIGIATGDAVVGNIGSQKRTKYGAVGRTVNLASRIESYTLGGEILIDEATRESLGSLLRLDGSREVHPKGFAEPVRIYRIAGIGDTHDVARQDLHDGLIELSTPISIRLSLVRGKHIAREALSAHFIAISPRGARLHLVGSLPELSDLRIELLDGDGDTMHGAFYSKVVSKDGLLVHFTTRSLALEAVIARAIDEK